MHDVRSLPQPASENTDEHFCRTTSIKQPERRMARLPRLTVPGYPHHVLQRGNNGQPIFSDAQDFRALLSLLAEHARGLDVAVHAWVLLPNQFRLLATPATEAGIPLLMQALGRGYVRYFNSKSGRSGTLWEGRYRATVIDPERYLLACMVSMDQSPVQAGVARAPAEYPWSSHSHYVSGGPDRLLTAPPLYWGLGNTPFAREAAYAGLVSEGVGATTEKQLAEATVKGWVLGGPDFIAGLAAHTDRRLVKRLPGRPRLPAAK